MAKSSDLGMGHKSLHTTHRTQYTVDQYPEPLHTMTAVEAMVSVQFMLIDVAIMNVLNVHILLWLMLQIITVLLFDI